MSKALYELEEKVKKLGFDIDLDFLDITWVKRDEDTVCLLEGITDMLRQDGGVSVYGATKRVDIKEEKGSYQLKVKREMDSEVLKTKKLYSVEEVEDFLLIYFRGSYHIHDHGKLWDRRSTEYRRKIAKR